MMGISYGLLTLFVLMEIFWKQQQITLSLCPFTVLLGDAAESNATFRCVLHGRHERRMQSLYLNEPQL
jgi:hypothetical protein